MKRQKHDSFERLLKWNLAAEVATIDPTDQCPDENLVAAFLEGTLPSEGRERFEAHVACCGACQRSLALTLKLTQSAARTPSLKKLALQLKPNWSLLPPYEWLHNRRVAPAMAIFLATLIGGFLGYELIRQRTARQEPLKIALTQTSPTVPSRETDLDSAPATKENVQSEPASSPSPEESATLHPSTSGPRPEGSPPPSETKPMDQETRFGALRPGEGLRPRAGLTTRKQPTKKENAPSATIEALTSAAGSDSGQAGESGRVGDVAATAAPDSSEQKTQPGRLQRPGSRVPSSPPPLHQMFTETDDKRLGELSKEKSADSMAEPSSNKERAKDEGSVGGSIAHSQMVRAETALRIESGGKSFQLRNNVWTDLAIDGHEKEVIQIRTRSPRYSGQMTTLSVYKEVLARPEDCLIKHDGKIYHIVKNH